MDDLKKIILHEKRTNDDIEYDTTLEKAIPNYLPYRVTSSFSMISQTDNIIYPDIIEVIKQNEQYIPILGEHTSKLILEFLIGNNISFRNRNDIEESDKNDIILMFAFVGGMENDEYNLHLFEITNHFKI